MTTATRPRRLTIAESEAVERQDCRTCGQAASETASGRHGCISSFEDGTWIFYAECVTCWNLGVAQARQERRRELAARPDCEACGRRKVGYTLAGVGLCRTCSKRAQWNLRQPMLFATGWAGITRERVLQAARA